MKICINPGHTLRGIGSGAVGIKNESEENRVVAREVISLLKIEGHDVIESKVDSASSNIEYLKGCVDIANLNKCDLFVSIHFNSYNKKAEGTEVLVYKNNSEAYNIGLKICDSIQKIGYKNRGVKIRPELYVLNKTTMKAVLIECCFIDNSNDISKYNYKTMARAIVGGIIDNYSYEDNKNESTDLEDIYRVCIGSYKVKANADKSLELAKSKGYKDAFIIK